MRAVAVLLVLGLAACASGPKLPPPNSAGARYDPPTRAVQVMVSNLRPVSGAALVAADGTRYPASGISFVSGPHVLYNPPPSIGLGLGGFGFTGGGVGIGSGLGFSVPVGKPTPSEVSDQYIASALIPVPADYPTGWANYRVEVLVGGAALTLAAPPPSTG